MEMIVSDIVNDKTMVAPKILQKASTIIKFLIYQSKVFLVILLIGKFKLERLVVFILSIVSIAAITFFSPDIKNRMLDRKDFKSLDEILRGNDIILLQNIVNGEFVYMPYNEYEKMSKELNQAGVFPVGQQFEQTSNPYEELEKVDKTPPPASNSDNLTNDNSDKGNIFDKMMDRIKDFELPFNKKKADITVPITIASAKRPSSMNDSNSGTNLGDINNGRLKYNEVFFNSIG